MRFVKMQIKNDNTKKYDNTEIIKNENKIKKCCFTKCGKCAMIFCRK